MAITFCGGDMYNQVNNISITNTVFFLIFKICVFANRESQSIRMSWANPPVNNDILWSIMEGFIQKMLATGTVNFENFMKREMEIGQKR